LLLPQKFTSVELESARHTHTVPVQSESAPHWSYVHERMCAPPLLHVQRPFVPCVQSESDEHEPRLPPASGICDSSEPRPAGQVVADARWFFGTRPPPSNPEAESLLDEPSPPASPVLSIVVPPHATSTKAKIESVFVITRA